MGIADFFPGGTTAARPRFSPWLVVGLGAGALTAMGLYLSRVAQGKWEPLETVAHVDLPRYMGLWYELGRLPNWFEVGCLNTTADYSLRADGRVDVLNRCNLWSFNGPISTARGVARVVDPQTNAKLKVSFFGPFAGDYWIIELGEEYEYAVVGDPSRKFLWILSRRPSMEEAKFQAILDRAAQKGFPIQCLKRTLQSYDAAA